MRLSTAGIIATLAGSTVEQTGTNAPKNRGPDKTKWLATVAAVISTLGVTAAANATVFDPTTLITTFNVITNQNLATTSEVIGNVLVGGDTNGGGGPLATGPTLPPAPTGYGAVNVFGTNTGTWAEPAGRTVYIGTGNTGAFLGAAVTGPPYPFPGANGSPGEPGGNNATFQTDIWNPLKAVSQILGGMATNGGFNTATGVFSAGIGPGPSVWNLQPGDLASFMANFSFPACLGGTSPTCDGVVNVPDTTYASGTRTFASGFPLPGLIFNFENATSLSFGNRWEASILSPFANVQTTAFLEGDVIANSIGSMAPIGAEIHNALFDCSDNLCVCPPGFVGCGGGTTNPDEPSPLALFGFAAVALVGFAVIRQRRASWGGAGVGPSGTI